MCLKDKTNEVNAQTDMQDDIMSKKSTKMIKIITAAVVVAAIVLNVLVSLISDSRLWYIDMTRSRYTSSDVSFYTLSEECIDLLEKKAIPMVEKINGERAEAGEEPIKVKIIFCSDRDYVELDERMRYISYTARGLEKEFSDFIEVEYKNITKNPSSVQKYKTTSAATIYSSDVIVEFGSEYLVQKLTSFFYQDDGANKPWAYVGEQRLSSMILSLTRAEAPVCALTVNHGERLFDSDGEVREEYSAFIKLVKGAGYDVVTLDLEKEEIPENCRMMICFDPVYDFKAFGNLGEDNVSEIEKLDRYLEDSNAFFYICNRETPKLDSLEEYLEEWGIARARATDEAGELHNYVLRDNVNCTDTGKGDIIIGKYGTVGAGSTITEDMQKQAYPAKVIFGDSTAIKPSDSYRKIFIKADEKTGTKEQTYYNYFKNGTSRTLTDIFSTYETASAFACGELYEIATAIRLFSLMTVTREERVVQESNMTSISQASYVISLSSTDFLTNEVLESSAYGNTDVLLSTLRNTGIETMPANIGLKAFYVYSIDNAEVYAQFNAGAWLVCLAVVPVAVAAIVGTVVLIRRRYR